MPIPQSTIEPELRGALEESSIKTTNDLLFNIATDYLFLRCIAIKKKTCSSSLNWVTCSPKKRMFDGPLVWELCNRLNIAFPMKTTTTQK